MQEFKNSDQFKSFMKHEAKRLNISVSNAYSTYISRTFLQKINKYYSSDIIIKGSSAEIAYLGRLVRAITDVDIATFNNFKVNKELIRAIKDKNDLFNYKLLRRIKKTKTGIYKISLQGTFGNINQHLGIDLQENYSRLIEPTTRIMPPIFEGDDPFEINVPSFEEYLAEKLCIIVESKKINVLNTRVKDFYDIYELHGGKYDSDKLTDYFGKMLKLRKKIKIEKADTLNLNKDFIDDHQNVWESTRKKYDFIDREIDLEGAVYYTRAVLREQLQKNGQEMSDNILHQYNNKIYKK